MAITTHKFTSIGSPVDDPNCPLPATMYIPDPNVFPFPRPAFVTLSCMGFTTKNNAPSIPSQDLANAGYITLFTTCRLISKIPRQTTTGKWHQQTDDLKTAIRFMRSDPGGLGYGVTGFVGGLSGSAGAGHMAYCAIDGTPGDDKLDCALCLSPPVDYSDRAEDTAGGNFITWTESYADSTDIPTLLARSPISLPLIDASPIDLWIGEHEPMPLTQKTLFDTAMASAGAVGYTSHLNTDALGRCHAWAMWQSVKQDALDWVAMQIPPP
jgi:hypothetical protein